MLVSLRQKTGEGPIRSLRDRKSLQDEGFGSAAMRLFAGRPFPVSSLRLFGAVTIFAATPSNQKNYALRAVVAEKPSPTPSVIAYSMSNVPDVITTNCFHSRINLYTLPMTCSPADCRRRPTEYYILGHFIGRWSCLTPTEVVPSERLDD